jgi:pimeloyl-ACP methyl ester carboxylesterase
VKADVGPVPNHLESPSTPPRGRRGPTLLASDGTELATRCWLTDEGADVMVVIAHGLTANKDDPKVVALADDLFTAGYEVVTYDSRGHGHSGGFCTLGKFEELDVAAVVGWARSRAQRIVLIGASMGAVGVLAYAAKDPELAGVVTVSSPGEWRLPLRFRSLVTAWLARTGPGRRWAERTMNVRIAPWASPDPAPLHLPGVHCPVVVIHGDQDPIIPRRSSLADRVVEDAGRELVVVPTMGHAFDPVSISWIREATTRLVARSSHAVDGELCRPAGP